MPKGGLRLRLHKFKALVVIDRRNIPRNHGMNPLLCLHRVRRHDPRHTRQPVLSVLKLDLLILSIEHRPAKPCQRRQVVIQHPPLVLPPVLHRQRRTHKVRHVVERRAEVDHLEVQEPGRVGALAAGPKVRVARVRVAVDQAAEARAPRAVVPGHDGLDPRGVAHVGRQGRALGGQRHGAPAVDQVQHGRVVVRRQPGVVAGARAPGPRVHGRELLDAGEHARDGPRVEGVAEGAAVTVQVLHDDEGVARVVAGPVGPGEVHVREARRDVVEEVDLARVDLDEEVVLRHVLRLEAPLDADRGGLGVVRGGALVIVVGDGEEQFAPGGEDRVGELDRLDLVSQLRGEPLGCDLLGDDGQSVQRPWRGSFDWQCS